MKGNPRTITAYVLIAAIPIVLAMVFIYLNVRQSLIASELSELGAIADLKAQIINNYFDSIRANVIAASGSFNIKTNLPVISRYTDNPQNADYIQAKKTLDAQLQVWPTLQNGIADVILTNASGTVVYTVNPEDAEREVGMPLADPSAFSEGEKGPYVGNFFLNKPDGNIISFFTSAPIYDFQNNFIGVITFESSPHELYQLIENASGLGKTGETLIATLKPETGTKGNVLFLNALRNDPGAAFNRQIPIGATTGVSVQHAVLGENGSGIAIDYGGNQTLAAWRYLPERQWGLVTQIDLEELLGPINALGISLITLSLIVALIATVMIFLLSRRSYDQFKFAVDNSSEQIVITDSEGIVLYANKATETLTGYALGDILGKKSGKLWNLPMSKEFYQNFWKIIKTDKKTFFGELKNRRKNGEVYDAEVKVSPVLDKKNNVVFFVGIERDVSENKRLIEIKDETIAKDSAILSSVGDGLVVTDEEGKITLANRAFEHLTGRKSTEVIGKLFAEVVPREDEQGNAIPFNNRVLEQVIAGKIVLTAAAANTITNEPAIVVPTSYFVRKDGTKFPVIGIVSPISVEGKIIGIVEVFRDITKEREVERAKDEFMSLASHQLRTPPSIINWYTETLQAGDLGPITEKQAEYLAEIYKANQRMIAIINSLLNISRLEMGTFAVAAKDIALKDIIDETAKELTSRFNRKIELITNYDPGLGLFRADPNILQIIIDNLLSNAFKYGPTDNTKIEIGAKMDRGSLLLSVKDNGIGIAPKDQGRVFEKLFRADNAVSANPDGTGLGLYMIKKIITDGLGGKIWFESEENKGTTFYVSLPASGMQEKTGTTTLTRVRYYQDES